jgi:hypothetical protein
MSQPANPGRGCPVCFKSGAECLCGLEPIIPAGTCPLPIVQIGMKLEPRYGLSNRTWEVVAIGTYEGPGSPVRVTLSGRFPAPCRGAQFVTLGAG